MREFILKLYSGRHHDEGSAIIIPSGLIPRTEDWHFTVEGRSFLDLAVESDILERELAMEELCLGISDEWKLASELPCIDMKEFKAEGGQYFIAGDYGSWRNMVA